MVLLEVPEGTVEIEAHAYKGRTDVTVVRFPASVKAIGARAFYGCSGITTLHLAEGLECIGMKAFASCPGIVGLHAPPREPAVDRQGRILLLHRHHLPAHPPPGAIDRHLRLQRVLGHR